MFDWLEYVNKEVLHCEWIHFKTYFVRSIVLKLQFIFTDIWWKWITSSKTGYSEQNKHGGLCYWHSEAAIPKWRSSRGRLAWLILCGHFSGLSGWIYVKELTEPVFECSLLNIIFSDELSLISLCCQFEVKKKAVYVDLLTVSITVVWQWRIKASNFWYSCSVTRFWQCIFNIVLAFLFMLDF
jgi:hypothetical protein